MLYFASLLIDLEKLYRIFQRFESKLVSKNIKEHVSKISDRHFDKTKFRSAIIMRAYDFQFLGKGTHGFS